MRQHPIHSYDFELDQTERYKDFFAKLTRDVERDREDRNAWEAQCADWTERRYARKFRSDYWPWPNAPLHKDTEILTIDGWLRIPDVKIGTLVLTRNDETRGSEWNPVVALPRHYSETLIHFHNQNMDLLVTPGHTMIYDEVEGKKTIRREARVDEGLTGYGVPLTSRFTGHDVETFDDLSAGDVLEFIGWYVAEGSMTSGLTIGIAQSKEANAEKCQLLEGLFDRLGFGWNYSGSTYYVGTRRGVPHWLREILMSLGHAKDRRLPTGLFHFAPLLLQRLMDGLIAGDGCVRQRGHHTMEHAAYYTTSEALAGDVQALAQLIGCHARIHFRTALGGVIDGRQLPPSACYEVSVLTDSMAKWKNLDRTEVPYGDFAYCVTVENHAIYVRYAGKACWTGNSDIVMPVIDMQHDRMKPPILSLVTNVKPPVTVLAIDRQSQLNAPNVELWFDWAIRGGSPRFIENIAYAIDNELEMGLGIIKMLWDYQARTAPLTLIRERLPRRLQLLIPIKQKGGRGLNPEIQGITKADFDQAKDGINMLITNEYELDLEEQSDREALEKIRDWLREGAPDVLQIKHKEVMVDAPRIKSVHPIDLILPQDASANPEEAERLAHEMTMTETMLRARAIDGKWDMDAIKELTSNKPKTAQKNFGGDAYYMAAQEQREGFYGHGHQRLFVIREVCSWFDVDKNGRDEKVVTLYSPQMPSRPLKTYIFDRKDWPYQPFFFEMNKDRWHAGRGITEKISDLDRYITFMHRARHNILQIKSAPTFLGRMNSMLNWRTQKWIPGQIIWTQDPSRDLREIVIQGADSDLRINESELRATVEAYLGVPDYANQNALAASSEPRTATEIAAVRSQSSQALSYRGTLFQLAMKTVYQQLFELWQLYGPQSVWMKVTDSEPIEISKKDLEGNFVFQPTGRIGEQDPVQEAQRALQRLQVMVPIVQAGLAGPKYDIDLGQLVMEYLEKDDVRSARMVVRQRSPEEIQQIEQEQEQQKQIQATIAGGQAASQIVGQQKPTLGRTG